MRAAIYARISLAKGKDPIEVGQQLEACRDLVGKMGADSVVEYVDNSISAYSGAVRPEFERLLTDLSAGRHDVLVCWHVDRLYRSLADLERIIDAIGEATVQTVNSGDLNLATSAGKMTARILGSVSRQESEHHAERRRAANHRRRAAGAWRKEGSRPFGYHGDGTPREPEASMIRQAVTDILSGTSIHEVARRWNASGTLTVRGVPWTNLHVRRVLTNPRLAALVAHEGQIVGKGGWLPIVDETLWRGLQAMLGDPSRRQGLAFERRHLLSGICRCAVCDGPLYAAYPHGKNRNPSYVCRQSHVGRSAPALDKKITDLVLEHLADQGVTVREKPDTSSLETRRTALAATQDELATLLRKGSLSVGAVERESAIIQAELDDIDRTLADAVTTHPAIQLLDGDGELRDRWDSVSVDVRAKIIDTLMSITVHPAKQGQRRLDPASISIVWK
ncbi:recombinase family protein [Mycobacterium sp. 21AC1]|uniref:recombinase family protein n=1 Tax=[Mycobacterium] appelbergii TaxID=2939269 RepID=UPI00293941FC|nr:recombinase family protein [Mycobacterium sp. 21AC1]MDV3127591.1 recombinase family protein [Mycobacterium sp. 21AC1]